MRALCPAGAVGLVLLVWLGLSSAQAQAQIYCPIEVGGVDPMSGQLRLQGRPAYADLFIRNRGNGVAMGVQVIGAFPVTGPGGGTAVMNRPVKFIDRLSPGEEVKETISGPAFAEIYSATVSACLPTQ